MDIEKTLPLAAGIASAFVSNHHVAPGDIPRLLADTHAAVIAEATGKSAYAAAGASSKPTPRTASEIKKSIGHEALISFEDGKPYRTLRRHLTTLGLTPQAYREKWGLPVDYPMTSPGYTEMRSKLAKSIGLGQRPTA
jgi:predicted transcriptional regulator